MTIDRGPRPVRGGGFVFLLKLVLFVVFGAGIVGLMLVLSGHYERKVGALVSGVGGSSEPKQWVEAKVTRRRLPRHEAAVGTIRAVHQAVVASKILARVEEVRVKAGQDVAQGEILVVLDRSDLKNRLEQAESALSAAKSRFEQVQLDFGRVQRLRDRGSATQSEFDQNATALKTAQAELDRAGQAVEEARIVESYATIRAPMSGRVIDKKVDVGDTASPGQPLLSMYDPARMQLVATVRESLAERLKVGQMIPARIDTLKYECNAEISEIVPEAQAESRSFLVKVSGPCPPGVYSGMFARLLIPMDEEDLLVVPEAAVRQVGQLEEVDVIEGNEVRRRVVQLGRTIQESRQVLSGLAEGERVALVPGTLTRTEPKR